MSLLKNPALVVLLLTSQFIGCNCSTESDATPETTGNLSRSDNVDEQTETKHFDGSNAIEGSRLQRYFEQYCDYTGGMGNNAPHNYDYKFRQHLKSTDNKELKRLFVLKHLYRRCEFAMRSYENGTIVVNKTDIRQMTKNEKTSAKMMLLELLDDLETFDPNDPEGEIARQRSKLNGIHIAE